MKSCNVHYKMTTKETTQQFKTKGELKHKRLTFYDQGKNHHLIVFHEKYITYFKKGDITMKYLFKKNTITKGSYTHSNIHLKLSIKTKDLITKDNYLKLIFDVIHSQEIINTATLVINFQ
ncbi:MAG: hypothetical protein K9L74_03100 [Candidatus Izimaplasma sp.]|nr:hypothetical protein [Candidatus Izimaplasma bacterium]